MTDGRAKTICGALQFDVDVGNHGLIAEVALEIVVQSGTQRWGERAGVVYFIERGTRFLSPFVPVPFRGRLPLIPNITCLMNVRAYAVAAHAHQAGMIGIRKNAGRCCQIRALRCRAMSRRHHLTFLAFACCCMGFRRRINFRFASVPGRTLCVLPDANCALRRWRRIDRRLLVCGPPVPPANGSRNNTPEKLRLCRTRNSHPAAGRSACQDASKRGLSGRLRTVPQC